MTTTTKSKSFRRIAGSLTVSSTILLSATMLAGCSETGAELGGGHLGGWANISATQRHPIIVGEEPAHLSLRVSRGSDGLSPHQRANLVEFVGRYRGNDSGNARLSIEVPAGTRNEVAALKAVADIRAIIRDYGMDDSRIAVQPYRAAGESDPSIRVSYTRFVAHAPECGTWPENLANDSRNLPYANFGCAMQRNLAMQVANPGDLVGPRTMTPTVAERRDYKWDKFWKSESTVGKKETDERASTKGND